MVFTVFSMVFTSSVELAFRSQCNFEGSVEQSMVFIVFSRGKHGIYKLSRAGISKYAQLSKALYLLCLAWCLQAQSGCLFEVAALLKAQSSKAWYLLCLARLSRAGSVFSNAQSSWRRQLSKAWHLLRF